MSPPATTEDPPRPTPAGSGLSPTSPVASAHRARRPAFAFGFRWLEVASLAILALLSAICARPLLEEWGFIDLFNTSGPAAYFRSIRNFPLRPLQGVPEILFWIPGHGGSVGFALGCFLVLAAKYAAARWAVSPIMRGGSRWIVASMAAILAPWPAEWLLRYSAAQLSAVFLFLLFGAVLRSLGDRGLRWSLVGAVAMLLMLTTYEALTLCAFLVPIVAILSRKPRESTIWRTRAGLLLLVRAALPIVGGLVLYALYSSVAVSLNHGNAGYEAGLGLSRFESVSGARQIIAGLYRTTYVQSSSTVLVFTALVIAMISPRVAALPSARDRIRLVGAFGLAIGALPILALPYGVSQSFVADPERVVFPVAVGFVLVCIVALQLPATEAIWQPSRLVSGAVVASLLCSTGLLADTAYHYHAVQRAVLTNTDLLAARHHAKSVILQDYSGSLGDVYTFLPPTLQQALEARHIAVHAVICTPVDVDRDAPIARRLQIETTPRCSLIPRTPQDIVIDVTTGQHGLIFTVEG